MREHKKIIKASFTLIELMIVVAIMALIAVLYPSSWTKDKSSLIKKCAMEMESVLMAIKIYNLNHAEYPKNAGKGKAVPELKDSLPDGFCFSNKTPVGGSWKFDKSSNAGYMQIYDSDFTSDEMARLDTLIDDGDLQTGDFIKVGQRYDYQIWNNK